MITELKTANAPAAIGPYSQGLDCGSMVFVSGQIPVNPATGLMPQTIEEQTAQCFANLRGVLAAAGLSMENVIKTTVFLSDLGDFAAMNGVQVAAIPKGAKVEIECIAVHG